MKKILAILFILIAFASFCQDSKPIDVINFKALQSPSMSYYLTDSSIYVYKGALYGWTKLQGDAHLKRYYVPYDNANRNVHLGNHTIKSVSFILDTTYTHTGLEKKGTLSWDETTQSIETHISNDLHLNNGEELWVPLCLNNSGTDILNGQPVYINSAFGTDPTIRLASNITYDESRLIGVATQDIPNSSKGRVTRFGYVNDVNLSGCTSGDNIYLGDKVLTHIRPTGGLFPVVVGKAIVCSTTGRLLVYPQTADYTAEVNKVDGWPSYLQGEQTNLFFTDANRTATISPVGSSYYFYQAGVKYIKYTSESFVISDVEGLHYIYYDGGIAYEMVNPSSAQILDIMRNKISVGVVYWDADNKVSIYGGNERHTFHWPFWVRAFIHTSFWTQYLQGLNLTNITLGIGSSNADAQFGMDSGSIADEDIITTTDAVSSTTGLPIYYRSGANGVWRRVVRSGYSFLNDGTTGLAMYNRYSGGVWGIVSMTNNYYRLVHVFATNGNTTNKQVVMSGVAEYASAAAAEAGVSNEISSIYNSNLPFAELKHIGTLILHTKTGLGNSVNARYVAIPSKPSGSNYFMDFRKSSIIPTGGGGSTVMAFTGLSDTFNSYASHSNKVIGINNLESGLEPKPVTIDGITGVVNIPIGATYNKGGVPIISQSIDGSTTTLTASQKAIKDYADTKEPLLAKGNLTENITGLEFSATRQIIGGTATLSVSAGYVIPTTSQIISTFTTTGNSGTPTFSSGSLNIPNYTLSGLGGEPAFSKNTAFNKNFGTTSGTVLEGRTFGTAANNNTGDFLSSSINPYNTSMTFDEGNRILYLTDGGETRSVTISQGNVVNCYTNTFAVISKDISVTWPSNFSDTNYDLEVRHWWIVNIGGKSVRMYGAMYDFTQTVSGFSCKLDTVVGYITYRAVNSSNLYPITISNYLSLDGGTMSNTNLVNNMNADLLDGQHGSYYATVSSLSNYVLTASITTTVSNPGSDSSVPTEKAVRTALSGISSMVYPSAGIAVSTGSAWSPSITDNHLNWDKYNQWDGGSTGLVAATGRTSLGGTTIGQAVFTSTNPSAIRFGRANADNSFSWLSDVDFRTAIGAGNGTVTAITAGFGLSGGTITNSGTFSVTTGTNSTTVCIGNDSRLSDTRTPTNSSVSYSKVATDLASSGTVTSAVDLSARSIGNITLSTNTTFSFSNYQLGKSYLLIVTANGYTPTLPSVCKEVTGNETLGTSGVFYINLFCIDATSGSEKLLTTIMKGK